MSEFSGSTAEKCFPKFGFSRVPREHVPSTLPQSVEFTVACPASAVVMMMRPV